MRRPLCSLGAPSLRAFLGIRRFGASQLPSKLVRLAVGCNPDGPILLCRKGRRLLTGTRHRLPWGWGWSLAFGQNHPPAELRLGASSEPHG